MENLIKLMLNNKNKLKLNQYELRNGAIDGRIQNINDVVKSIQCDQDFIFSSNYDFCVGKYVYNVLYEKTTTTGGFYWNDEWHDAQGKKHVKFKYIIEIYDNENNRFYLYCKKNFTAECHSCDGNTNDHMSKIIYDVKLERLLNFIYTTKQLKVLYENLTNMLNKI